MIFISLPSHIQSGYERLLNIKIDFSVSYIILQNVHFDSIVQFSLFSISKKLELFGLGYEGAVIFLVEPLFLFASIWR